MNDGMNRSNPARRADFSIDSHCDPHYSRNIPLRGCLELASDKDVNVKVQERDAPEVPPREHGSKKAGYRTKIALRDPTALIGVLTALLFTYLIVVPIISMISDAFRVQSGDERNAGLPFGSWTTYYLDRVFLSPVSRELFWNPLLHTLSIALAAIVVALVVGGSIAWLLARTNLPGRKWFSTALIVPYMLPSWTLALAWTTLFKNRSVGGQLGWLEAIGLTPPNWMSYGWLPITVVLALHYSPYCILLMGNALRNFDSQMEDSARMLGSTPFQVAKRVTIPLMRPALLSAMTLIFAKCIGDFGVAYVLGSPTGYKVLSTSLYSSIYSGDTGTGAVLAAAIILIGMISLIIDMTLLKEAKRFVTKGGKGAMSRLVVLGRFKKPLVVIVSAVFVVSVIIPITTLVLSTIMRTPGKFALDNFTLQYWIGHDLDTVGLQQGILLTPDLWAAAWNSVWICGLASIAAGLLGLLVGYVVVRTPIRFLGGYLRQVTFLPYLVPGIAFAVAYLSLFAVQRGPIPALYGTAAILVIALIAEQMPFASRAGITSMMQLGKDPEEAAQVAGAGWWKRMVRVVVPVQKASLSSGVLMPFISGVKGLSLVVILAVPGTDLLTTYSLRLVDYGYTQASNAVVLVVSAIAFFGTLLGQKLTKSSLSDGI